MDVKVNNTPEDGQYLEYNTMGGIIDLYFMAGPSPTEVAKQYSEVAGTPAMMPYWGLGFHQCRYGYRDFYAVAEVVSCGRILPVPETHDNVARHGLTCILPYVGVQLYYGEHSA